MMASEILVHAFVGEGRFAAAIPYFGFERRGAPLAAFVRFDDQKIREKTQVYRPDCVLVTDPSLRRAVDVFEGLTGEGLAVLNDNRMVGQLELPETVRKVGLVDATTIAVETLGVPITNTAVLGAFARTTGWLSLDSLLRSFENFFKPSLLEANRRAVARAYDETRVEVR